MPATRQLWYTVGLMAAVLLGVRPADAAAAEPPQPNGRVFRALGAAIAAGFKQDKDGSKSAATTAADVAIAEPPPGWIDIPPSQKWTITEQGLQGDVYRMRIAIGSCESRAECEARLPDAVEAALLAYAERARPAGAGSVRFDAEGLGRRVAYKDTRELVYNSANAGPRTQLHAVLEFDRHLLDDVKDRWNRAIVGQRLWYTGTGLGAVLGLLGVIYCGLVLDRATDGKRRGRLGTAAVAAGTLIVAAAAAVIAAAG